MKKNGRFWEGLSQWNKGGKGFVPFQGSRGSLTYIPESIARMVYEEYEIHHSNQSFERLHERGGFGVGEVIAALGDIIERQRHMEGTT